PRPLPKPEVDPQQARAFGRPQGVSGSFTPGSGGDDEVARPSGSAREREQDPVLAEAFGRPDGVLDDLQRDPHPADPDTARQDPSDAPHDPWRDPSSAASLAPASGEQGAPTGRGERLGVREVLFGGRVSVRALATLGVLALVIGVFGGLIGRYTAEVSSSLTSSSVALVQSDDDAGGQADKTASIASSVLPSVVSVQVSSPHEVGSGSGV